MAVTRAAHAASGSRRQSSTRTVKKRNLAPKTSNLRSVRTSTLAASQESRRSYRPRRHTRPEVRTTAASTKPSRVLRSSTTTPNPPPAPSSSSAPEGDQPKVKKPKRRARADPWSTRKRKRPRAPPSPPPTHFTCRICIEEQPVSSFIKYVNQRNYLFQPAEVPPGCIVHLAKVPRRPRDPVCKTCIGRSMVSRHDLVGAQQVGAGCLEPGCLSYWSFFYIARYFPPGAPFEKYNLDMTVRFLRNNSLTRCINPACTAAGLLDLRAPGYPHVECHAAACATRFCAQCRVPWHEGQTCAEYAVHLLNDKMTDPEIETLRLMQSKDGKRCPNCYLVIEKDGGCNSVRCTGCNRYFNWEVAASAVPSVARAMPANSYGDPMYKTNEVCEADRKK